MSLKILIVEDEPLISEDIASIITKEGYQVIGQAYDGISALDIIHNRKPDIVLLDISLDHQITGIDIAKIINNKYSIPFIFITSYSDKQTLDQAKNLLPEGYIVKPFKKKDILATLEIVAHRVKIQKQKSPYFSLEEMNQGLEDQITPKEYDILLDVVSGMSNEKICEKHYISLNTVKTHMKRIFVKLEIENRSQIAAKMYRK
ncbi:MAG TPA: response regulator transcription factor [Saprospiraceae bacterium]|nr:response regulator transcription factor [Saprospiraceae bacterium]HMU05591.1 response regulator transcription factor [Saprospiraceae bacterium]